MAVHFIVGKLGRLGFEICADPEREGKGGRELGVSEMTVMQSAVTSNFLESEKPLSLC